MRTIAADAGRKIEYTGLYMGMDPEFFLLDKEGVLVPADNLLPSQDEASETVSNRVSMGSRANALYYDGIQGEMSIGPSYCRAYVMDNICRLARALYQDVLKPKEVSVCLDGSVEITPEILKRARFKRSRQFGCDPDFGMWEGGMPNVVGVHAETHMLRYAGGHIHLGVPSFKNADITQRRSYPWALLTGEGRMRTVKMLDVLVGLPLVMLERESDRRRREQYGKAGCFRDPDHGIEYRVPSALTILHPSLTNLFLDLARTAVDVVVEDQDQHFLGLVPQEELIAAINSGDKALAYQNFCRIKQNLNIFAKNSPNHDIAGPLMGAFEYLAMVGVEEAFKDDFVTAWGANTTKQISHGSLAKTWREHHKACLEPFGDDWKSFEKEWSVEKEMPLFAATV